MEKRDREENTDTESRILKAAEKEFLTRGFSGARTTSIADAAGVNHALIHYYFRTKERLFKRVMEAKINLVANTFIVKFKDADRSFAVSLREAIAAHFDFAAQNPELPRFMFCEVMRDESLKRELRDKIREVAGEVLAKLQEKIDKEAATGHCAGVDARDIMMDIVSLNIFAVVGVPFFQSVLGVEGEEGRKMILARRKEENIQTILSKLQIKE